MPPQAAPRQTLEDIERLERVPLATRLAVSSTYELLYKAVASSPEQPPRSLLPLGDQSHPGQALTTRAFLRMVHQSANLLADLGMGPSDVVALLLPDLLEKELLLWAGQAVGIVCPIPPSLPTLQVVDLLQVAKVKVLVAPSPEVDRDRRGESLDSEQWRQHSHLFTVRLWHEELGNGQMEWRGKVQDVTSGEARYFREWSKLLAFLIELLAKSESLLDRHFRSD